MTQDINGDIELAKSIKTDIYDPNVWGQMKGMAEVFIKSGALSPEENPSKLMVKMQAGREMGMKPMEAIKSFYFVKGTINIFGSAVARRLREHGWRIEYKDEVDKCTATVSKGEEKYTDTLTFEDARQSGWTHVYDKLKPGWLPGANRKLKLRYGVTSLIIKTYLPEVLGSATDIAEVAMDAAPVIAQEPAVTLDDNDPITDGQRATLKTLGVDAPDDITKSQAARLIMEAAKPEPKKSKTEEK